MTDKRKKEGETNVKIRSPPKESLKPSHQNFTGFPKSDSPKYVGLGYVPPAHFSNSMNVKANNHVNNAFMKFSNDMFSFFRKFMCDGLANPRANVHSPHPQRRKKRNSSRSASPNSTKSPMPKEKSKKGTSSKVNCDTNPKEPIWQWVPKLK